jgi:hypothetical protein
LLFRFTAAVVAGMGELETRLAAVELAIFEIGAWLDPQAVADAQASIRAALATCGPEERDIRLGALGLIEDARKRFA